MGMQDRDYYREDYAKKNGMRYDRGTGKYFYPSRFIIQKLAKWHPVLIAIITIAICVATFGVLKFITSVFG